MGLREQTQQDQASNDTKTLDDYMGKEFPVVSLRSIGESIEQSGKTVLDSFVRLYRAHEFSVECNRSPWQFAIELQQLQRTGITTEEVRWLIGKNLVDHAEEISMPGDKQRTFQSPGGFTLTERTCLILTDFGVSAAQHTIETIQSRPFVQADQPLNEPLKPRWDTVRHELRLGNVLVKKFKWRAANQEAILNAFEEDGWPAHIDDPLTQSAQVNPKRRLSDAIKCLNRKQQNPLIRFCGDGTGEGVLWELVEEPAPAALPAFHRQVPPPKSLTQSNGNGMPPVPTRSAPPAPTRPSIENSSGK